MYPDSELLQRYAGQRDEGAFRALVEKHLGLVHAAALRRTGGRSHLAEEICQKVFTDLARKAGSLHRHPALAAWLHRSTRYAAIDAIRAEARRQKFQETLAAMPDEHAAGHDAEEWARLRPVLDEALDQLKEADRVAVVLRYFEGLSFADVGARLGLSENAARMKAERALGKLRLQLGRRGVTSATGALGLVLANRAVAAAPEGLAGTISAQALAGAAKGLGAGVLGTLVGSRFVAWGALVAAVLGAGYAGWSRFGPARARPMTAEMVIAAEGFSANALEVYRLMSVVYPASNDQPAGGPAARPPAPANRAPAGARDAMLDFAEASRARNVPRLAQLVTFDAAGAEVARKIHAGVPAELRAQMRTPEELFAFFYATDTLLSPVPPAEFLQTFIATEIKPGRAAVHRPNTPPRGLEFVLTAEGWKHEIPTHYLTVVSARILSSETLARLNALPEVRARRGVAPGPGEPGTARAALAAFAAACNRGDVPAVAAMLQFDPAALPQARAFMDSLAPDIRGKWRSPEELAADMFVNGALNNPFPSDAVLATAVEQAADGQRVILLLPDATRDRFEFVRTESGWKYAITAAMVDDYLRRLARNAAPRP
jgi:RNA polymerase sigma factor (sigma-70 family)